MVQIIFNRSHNTTDIKFDNPVYDDVCSGQNVSDNKSAAANHYDIISDNN